MKTIETILLLYVVYFIITILLYLYCDKTTTTIKELITRVFYCQIPIFGQMLLIVYFGDILLNS